MQNKRSKQEEQKKPYLPAEIQIIPLMGADLMTLSQDQGEWDPLIE